MRVLPNTPLTECNIDATQTRNSNLTEASVSYNFNALVNQRTI